MAAEAVLSVAVETLGNLLIQKAVFLQGVEGEVEWVRTELKRMRCFLKDAANKQSDSDSIRNWISEIREVAYDAEDAIERFVVHVETRGLQERCACFPHHLSRLDKIGKEIESIRKRLKDIESSRLSYGIQDLGESSRTRSQLQVESRRRLAYWEQDRDVVGLEKDVELLLGRAILEERGGLSVASILGMGGIGKSTLARKIYNHPRIAGGYFESRAWVVVSSEFTTEDIMRQILVQLGISLDRLKLLESVDDRLSRQQNLQKELHKCLTGKRYLIVLDDVWEASHWESLGRSFPVEDKSSRLLLTSRNQVMGEYSQFVHNLKLLDTNQSWELLMKKAFIDNTNGKCPEELQNSVEEILKWCGGLPLAISVVGGLLKKRAPNKKEWEKVVKEMKSHMDRNEDINSISAILELSYQNLPPEVKACFLCLGFFKEDDVINVNYLVQLWVAQGLVAQEVVGEEETMEDVAMDYLNQLISRNMVQVKRSNYDLVRACHMHDLLRDLSKKKAKEEINLEVQMREEGDSHHSLHKPRHRAIYHSGIRLASSSNRDRYLRSLLIHADGVFVPSSYLKSLELLRVLNLGGVVLNRLPKAIGALTGLRYIKLRLRVGGESKLPRSWAKLTNLQVLDLRRDAWIAWHLILDEVILKMDCLRHLYALISSRSKDVPLANMKNLQTLKTFLWNESPVWLIQGMAGVTTLKLGMAQVSDATQLFTHLAGFGNLISLSLRLIMPHLNMDGLAALHHITRLKLHYGNAIKRLTTIFSPNISYLTLIFSGLDEDPMPILERLPELLYLKLDTAYYGEEMVISHQGFPSLKVLRLINMQRLRNIQIEKGGMPEIKQLFIFRCPSLSIEDLPEHLKSAINH